MKSLKFFSILFLAVLSLASCQKEDDLMPATETQSENIEMTQDVMSAEIGSRSGCEQTSIGYNYYFNQAYNLNTQAQVDAFDPCITTIDANFIVNGPNIHDLTPLKNIKTVNGWMDVQNTTATSLKGLENLRTVNGRFRLIGNSQLTDMTPVENIEYVDGVVAIVVNQMLNPCPSLDSLAANATIEGFIIEYGNGTDCPQY